MKHLGKFLILASIFFSFGNSSDTDVLQDKTSSKIKCSKNGCTGTYIGPEFVNRSDVAHQFSNKMSGKVGDKLKWLYKKGIYSKVDLPQIAMSTKGMGSGFVTYKLMIPFLSVSKKCDAFTSFDHVGGWNHKPALTSRMAELDNVLMNGQKLDVSKLKKTPEGLQEYWIQWKNKSIQSDCN